MIKSIKEDNSVTPEENKIIDFNKALKDFKGVELGFVGLERNIMSKAVVSLSAQNKLLIAYPNDEAPMKWLDKPESQAYVKKVISEYVKKETDVEFQRMSSVSEIRNTIPDILSMPGINITVLEED